MDEQQQWIAAAVGAAVIVFVVGVVAWRLYQRDEAAKLAAPIVDRPRKPRPPRPVEIARLEQQVKLTGLGILCVVMLILSMFVGMIVFWSDTSAIRQAAAGTILIASVMFFGFGAVMGRRYSYVVTRMQDGE